MIVSEKQEIRKKIDKIYNKNGKLYAISHDGDLMVNNGSVYSAKYYVAANNNGLDYRLPNGAENVSEKRRQSMVAAFNDKQICLPCADGESMSFRKYDEIPDKETENNEYLLIMYIKDLFLEIVIYSRFHNCSVFKIKMRSSAWDDMYDIFTALLTNEDAEAAKKLHDLKKIKA